MKYYHIDHSIKPKVIGRKFPQVMDAIISPTVTSLFGENYIGHYYSQRAPEGVEVPIAVLAKSAKMTHILSVAFTGFTGLLISRRLKEILEPNSYGIQFVPTKAIHEALGIEADYFIAHLYKYADDLYVDREKSEFEIVNYATGWGERLRHLVLKENDVKHDYFCLQSYLDFANANIISERAKRADRKIPASGIEIYELNQSRSEMPPPQRLEVGSSFGKK